jgi:hypothetical protein
MKSKKLVSEQQAIELACNHYKEHGTSFSPLGKSEHEETWDWERSVTLSLIQVEIASERNGVAVVHDNNGLLVPQFTRDLAESVGIYDDRKGERLITKAEAGDQLAHKVLCYFAAGFVKSGCEMPNHLREYIAADLKSLESRKGRDPYANSTRNFYIALTVYFLVGLGFQPTRNRKTVTESACSITQLALARCGVHMEEPNIEKIWGQFRGAFEDGAS